MTKDEERALLGELLLDHAETKRRLALIEAALWIRGEKLRAFGELLVNDPTKASAEACALLHFDDLPALLGEHRDARNRFDEIERRRRNVGF